MFKRFKKVESRKKMICDDNFDCMSDQNESELLTVINSSITVLIFGSKDGGLFLMGP